MSRLDESKERTGRSRDTSTAGKRDPRKPYRKPQLKVYGRLAEVTRFGGSTVIDSGGGLGNEP